MNNKIIEILGWCGVAAIVGAYALVSFSIIAPDNIYFQLLNFTGAIFIVLVSFRKRNYQPGILNLTWTIIALVAILKIVF